MRIHFKLVASAAGLSLLTLAGASLVADKASADAHVAADSLGRVLEVTITNITRGQTFSPPLLLTHDEGVSVFELGMPASAELAELAENGDNSLLAAALGGSPGVLDLVAATAGIPPGGSATYMLRADASHRYLSAAGMLVSSNDSFFALNGATSPGPGFGSDSMLAPAYDSGTEFNSEDCMYVPGPPCGAGAVHDPRPAEGYVYVSNGIHGIGGLASEEFDWRNPVALVSVVVR